MVPLKRGRIINFASLLSFQGGFTVPAYASSKGGVVQLTRALSNEWSKEGVCVNAIAPGYIETDMNEKLLQDPVRLPQISERIPAGRWGRPEDFAGPVVFLASKASQYVCGEVLVVDGVSCSIHCTPFRFPSIGFPNLFPGSSPLLSWDLPMISLRKMVRQIVVHVMPF
jgi:NAD(P)-dependent dehydrogenase (short-subunit alcohol dehydrogenase family)